MTDIRVGLTELYGHKQIINIYNNSVDLGYCNGNVYSATESLYSDSGFTFEIDSSDYYISQTIYPNRKSAVNYCNRLYTLGLKAYCAGIGLNKWKVYITSSEETSSIISENKDLIFEFKTLHSSITSDKTILRFSGAYITILLDKVECGTFPQFRDSGSKPVSLGTRKYRGRIEPVIEDNSITAVNIINIEAYLLGVVTCEMGPDSPEEALCAQAVSARSFAAAKAGFSVLGSNEKPYIITDTTADQVYKGYTYETSEGYNAVKKTLKQVIYNSGHIVQAFYFSTSGGSTESVSDMWNVKSSIFTTLFDKYEKNPEIKPWIYDFSLKELENIFKSADYNLGTISEIKPTVITESGRVYTVSVKGSGNTLELSGSRIRSLLNLPGTKFRILTSESDSDKVNLISLFMGTKTRKLSGCYTISGTGTVQTLDKSLEQAILISESNFTNICLEPPKTGIIRFAGNDYGHGVGMSQSGAKGMAQAGFTYREIIDFYYKNVTIGSY